MSSTQTEVFGRRLLSCVSRLWAYGAVLRFLSCMVLMLLLPTGWRTWRGIVTGFVPVGLCLLAVMQWRAYRKHSSRSVASSWEIELYCSLPLRTFSRVWGWCAELRIPEPLRPWVYGLYANAFHVNMEEAVSPDFRYYPSLAAFFARALKEGARQIDVGSTLTSPCDGRVLHFGPVNSCTIEQVKGVTYSLQEFLCGDRGSGSGDLRQSLLQRPEGVPTTLYQCILYLAPGDYHRFHSPAGWRPDQRLHFSGRLLSVSPTIARRIPGLFAINERAVYTGRWQHGFFSFTAVGATNVGSMRVYFDETLRTNSRAAPQRECVYLRPGVTLAKGDMMGEFRMGSTIVLIFEAPYDFQFGLTDGQGVRVGQPLGSVNRAKHVDKMHTRNDNVQVSAA